MHYSINIPYICGRYLFHPQDFNLMTNIEKFHPDQLSEDQKEGESVKENTTETDYFEQIDIPYLVKRSLSQYQPAPHRIIAIKEKILKR